MNGVADERDRFGVLLEGTVLVFETGSIANERGVDG